MNLNNMYPVGYKLRTTEKGTSGKPKNPLAPRRTVNLKNSPYFNYRVLLGSTPHLCTAYFDSQRSI